MLKTPDITKAQIIALVQAVILILVAFSVPISDAQSTALLGLTTIVASILIVGDAAIRRGRAKIVEANIAKELEMKNTAAAHILLEANQEKARLEADKAETQKDM